MDRALAELFALVGIPEILCLGEVTREAAEGLRDRVLPAYRVASLDVKADKPTLQVAILYKADSADLTYREQLPISAPRTPRGTRPMAVLDVSTGTHTIRVIACHWQARMDEQGSKKVRFRAADHLAGLCHDFINERPGLNDVAIVGDLNEEPFEENLDTLNAHRHRGRSQGKAHWADHDVKRTHLYNTSWRLLGEKHPHPAADAHDLSMQNAAGTYYWEEEQSWRHFDQLIVSGGLLQPTVPYIDEAEIGVVSSPAFLTDGLPIGFTRDAGKYRGVSDHLPLFAKIHI